MREYRDGYRISLVHAYRIIEYLDCVLLEKESCLGWEWGGWERNMFGM